MQTAQTDQPVVAFAEGTASPQPEIPAVTRGRENSPAVSRAIDEVRQIVESLEQVLEQMEEVRELVETVERQKSSDEREIESLRRALRRIHQPRGHQEKSHEQGG